jgi:hypothetical protein
VPNWRVSWGRGGRWLRRIRAGTQCRGTAASAEYTVCGRCVRRTGNIVVQLGHALLRSSARSGGLCVAVAGFASDDLMVFSMHSQLTSGTGLLRTHAQQVPRHASGYWSARNQPEISVDSWFEPGLGIRRRFSCLAHCEDRATNVVDSYFHPKTTTHNGFSTQQHRSSSPSCPR